MPTLTLHLIQCQSSMRGVYCLGNEGLADLGEADSKALMASVQAITDYSIEYQSPLLWKIKNVPKGLKTTKLKKVVNKELREFMPTGETSLEWKRWMTEVQMIFHSHEINERREDNNQTRVDALWLSCNSGFLGL